jgi:AcrR family transcriptional regulator
MPAKSPAPKRAYNSQRRQAQAEETRRQILAAARGLFVTRGYVGTTIEAVAREAGVATETMYATFGSKRALLARLVDVSVVGDEAPVPLLERPGPQAVAREKDQRRQIRLFAHQIREIMERVGPLFEVLNAAAKTEPDIAGLLAQVLGGRHAGMQYFVQAVARNGALRQGLSAPAAADTVFALTSAEVHRLLTVDRGWPGEQYEKWLGDTLAVLLLR